LDALLLKKQISQQQTMQSKQLEEVKEESWDDRSSINNKKDSSKMAGTSKDYSLED
jgi:hypothetical protein